MALNKVTYVDGKTVISAENLNDIQDEVINNTAELEVLSKQVSEILEATVE